MDYHAQKIKIFFTLSVFVIIIGMTFGIFVVRSTDFFTRQNFSYVYSFIDSKIAYEFSGNRNVLTNVISIMGITKEEEIVDSQTYFTSSVPVLLYHGVVDKADRFNITEETFRDQMFALKNAGYRTITVADLEAFNKGDKKLDNKDFLLTFDDGRIDSYRKADPILKAVGYTAVMYIATESSLKDVGEKKSTFYVNENDIEDMIKSGRWEIGSHAVQETGGYVEVSEEGKKQNFLSNKKWIESESRLETDSEYETRVAQEIHNSKNLLEEKFGITVSSFSYPFGDYGQVSVNNPKAKDVINKFITKNYTLSFRQVWPNDGQFAFNQEGSDPYFLKRIETPTNWSGEELVQSLVKSQQKVLPIMDNFEKDNGWMKTWGLHDFDKNTLNLLASSNSTGAAVFLDGTNVLKDYLYYVDFDWVKGSNVSLISRYRDSKNYLTCNFSQNRVRLESYIDGVPVKLSDTENFIDISTTTPISLAMFVDGDFAKCMIGNTVVSYASIPDVAGGVGIKIWDQKIDNASIRIKEVNVIKSEDILDYLGNSPYYPRKVTEKVLSTNNIKVVKDTPSTIEKTEQKPSKTQPLPIQLFDTQGNSIPYNGDLNNLNGWKNMFGELYAKNNTLVFSTNASTTSSMAVLEGSEHWTDYVFNVKANWHKGATLTLVARYKDAKNYVGCSFSQYGRSARLFYVLDGKTYTIGQSPQLGFLYIEPWKNNDLSIYVDKENVQCLKDNVWVMRGDIKEASLVGGVGIKTYEKFVGEALIAITKMTVTGISN